MPTPFNSKIDFNVLTRAQDESDSSLQMFSPPSPAMKISQPNVPSFFKILEPKTYDKMCQNKQDGSQCFQNTAKSSSEIAAEAVKHKLDIMHLIFPGQCKFVSVIFFNIHFRI